MVKRPFVAWIILTLLAATVAGCSGLAGEPLIVSTRVVSVQPTAQPISLPQTAPDLTNGAQVYAANCTRCHGVTGKADGEMVTSGKVTGVTNFTDPKVSLDAAPIDWFEVVTNGRMDKLMPPWNDKLTEAQRWDVTMYVYNLANTPEIIAQGKTVWVAQCADCHGQNGEGTTKGKPLPNLLKEKTNALLATVANGIPDKMTAFADKISAEDSAAVIAYTRLLSLGNVSAPVAVASAPTAAAGGTSQEPSTTAEPNTGVQPATTADASANAVGTVSGKVVNMSSGGTVPADLPLTLYVVSGQNSQAPQQVLTTTAKSDGTYLFENVPASTDQHYVVMATYKDTVYTSEMVPADPTHPKVDLAVNIYEVSDDPAKVKISEMVSMMQVDPTTNQLQVVQIVSFTNDSDHAFVKTVDGKPTSTSVKLPKGATFQDFSSGTYKLSADGTEVVDSEPVLPGSPHLMHLGYSLPYTGQISIEQALGYALSGKVQLMIASNGLSIAGDQFAPTGSTQMGNQTYQTFGGDFTRASGESIRYDVSGTVTANSSSTTSTSTTSVSASSNISPFAYALIGIGLVAIGTAIGFFMRERTDQRSQPQSPVNDLMKQIADLDIKHNEGKIGEAQYLKQRTALKSQLMLLMKSKSGKE